MQKTVLNKIHELLQQFGTVGSEGKLAGTGQHAVNATCVHCVLTKSIAVWAKLPYAQANFSTTSAVCRRQTHTQSSASSVLS